MVFVSGFLALLGIRILISSFDNDGDGMANLSRDGYQFSILEGSLDMSASREIFLVVDFDHCQFVFSFKSLIPC